MKKLFLLPLFIFLATLISFKDDDSSLRGGLPYFVKENKSDSTLKKTESLFVFTFFDENNEPISQPIKFSYNGIEDSLSGGAFGNLYLKVKPGTYLFRFFYTTNNYEITTDSIFVQSGYRCDIQVNFQSSVTPVICFKPVIYVYPKQSEQVKINLDLKGKLGFTYPTYQNGWDFIADPDGTIHMNDKKYQYLFWDGKMDIANEDIDWKEGYVVKKDSLVPFFEKTLALMGLNSKEIEDYITFWCPLMQVNENNYVHFLFNAQYDQYASLTVTPKPDQLFRVFMLWSKADEGMKVNPQPINFFRREGFTVVEWGGAEMNKLP